MRDIKFRAWDKTTNGMVLLNSSHDSLMFYRGYATYTNLQNGSGGTEYDLMQYTGLKDKNGVEIYEGDIVRINDKRTAVIEWISAAWGYRNCMSPNSSEVIGNIYENPDLLK